MNQNDTQPPEDVASSSNPMGTGWSPAWQEAQTLSKPPDQIPTKQKLLAVNTPFEQSNNTASQPQSQISPIVPTLENVKRLKKPISFTRIGILIIVSGIMLLATVILIRDIDSYYDGFLDYLDYSLFASGYLVFYFIVVAFYFITVLWLLSRNLKLISVHTIACLINALIFSHGTFELERVFGGLDFIDVPLLLLRPNYIWIPILMGTIFLGPLVFIWREGRGQNFMQAIVSNQEIRHQKGPVPMVDNTVMTTSELRGQVHGFRERTETRGSGNPFAQHTPTIVWTYRLERYHDGERLDPIPVEMRGHSFTGLINDGDEIMINKKWRKGKMLRTNRVFNLTSGAEVKTLRRISANTIAHIVFYIFLAAIIFFWLVYLGN